MSMGYYAPDAEEWKRRHKQRPYHGDSIQAIRDDQQDLKGRHIDEDDDEPEPVTVPIKGLNVEEALSPEEFMERFHAQLEDEFNREQALKRRKQDYGDIPDDA